jgi:uncharacterized membrane protein YeaQ/YmgE (transglycosylase-associated protein family)
MSLPYFWRLGNCYTFYSPKLKRLQRVQLIGIYSYTHNSYTGEIPNCLSFYSTYTGRSECLKLTKQKSDFPEDEMNIILWIIFGALAGWIASMIMGANAQMGALANIVVGIVGALIGGFIMNAFGAQGVTGFNLTSLIVAVIGAVVLLFLVGLVRRT